jgi:hypothetical protein
MSINNQTIEGIGFSSNSLSEQIAIANNLVKINRYVIYNNRIVNAYVYVWN